MSDRNEMLMADLESLINKYRGKEHRWMMNLHKNDLKSPYFKGFVKNKEIAEPRGLSTVGRPELNPNDWVGIYRKV